MLRRQFIAAAALATGAALGLAAPAAAQTKWNLPAAYPADNPHTVNLVQFGKDIEAATGGKLAVTVHANATLFKAPDIKRAVMTGQAQMGEVLISIHENESPLFGVDVVPFLATSFEASKKLWTASKPAIAKKLDEQGLVLLYSVPWPPQGLYSKNEIKTIEDMKGIKWRAYNVGTARIGELVGAQGVTVQAAELPQALATGVVTSFMSSGATGYDSKVWESLKYFYVVDAWMPRNLVFVNKAAFNGLDKATQDAVLKAAAAAEERGTKMWEEKTQWYLDQLKAKGMVVEKASPALEAGFKKVGETLTADWVKKAGPDGAAVIEAYKK